MKRLLAVLISLAIMAVIFAKTDLHAFGRYVSELDFQYFFVAVLLFIPQTVLSAVRWRYLIQRRVQISLWESLKLILSASSLNIFLPSKMGDFCKAYFLKKEGKLDLKRGTNVILFERYMDLASLGIVALVGALGTQQWNRTGFAALFFSVSVTGLFPLLFLIRFDTMNLAFLDFHPWPRKIHQFLKDTQQYLLEIKEDPQSLLGVIGMSVFLWFLHILQFYFIFLSLRTGVSLFKVFCLVPLGILAGLLPVTVAGIGARDTAFLVLFSSYAEAPKIVFVGLFASVRYFVPGILGLPFFNQYLVREAPHESS